jgi:PAS domain S-box-containing protein
MTSTSEIASPDSEKLAVLAARLAPLLDALEQPALLLHVSGRVCYANANVSHLLGCEVQPQHGRAGLELLSPDGRPMDWKELAAAPAHDAGPLRIGLRVLGRTPVTWALARRAEVPMDSQPFTVVLVSPVAPEAAVEGADAAGQRAAVLFDVTRLLADSHDRGNVAESVLARAGSGLLWDAGAWWELGDTDLTCVAFWTRSGVRARRLERKTVACSLAPGLGLPGRVLADGDVLVLEDLASEPDLPRAPEAVQDGLLSAVGIPIRAGASVLGVLEFYRRHPGRPGPEQLQVMTSIGAVAGHYLQRTRAEKALRESEDRYRRLVEVSPEAIIVHQDGRIVFVNRAALGLFGVERDDDLVGKPVLDFIHDDYKDLVANRHRRVLEEGEDAGLVDEKFVRPDGRTVDVEVMAIRTVYNGRPAYQMMVRDVTDRNRAEAKRREAEERYAHLFENAVFGVFRTTPEGRFLNANGALAQMLGYDSPEDLRDCVSDIGTQVHVDPSRREELARRLAEEGSVTGFEAKARRRDGSLIDISISARAVVGADGDMEFEGIIEDITMRKQAVEDLREQKRVLETIEQVGAHLASELDLQKAAQALTDAATDLTGARFGAFYYRRPGDDPDSFTLYTLSGARPEDVDGLKATDARPPFGFSGVSVLRLNDITGSAPGLMGPAGESVAVKSYLAVPVISRSGEVIGGLVFGHEEPGAFKEHHEALAAGIARWAGIAVDNARLYAESQEAQEQLRRANEAKDEFLGLVSHELRTPITTIYGGARLLQSRADRLEQARKDEVLSDIEQESERLYRLIEDLLALARLELGASIGLRPVLLQRVADKMLAGFVKRRPSRRFEVEIPDSLPPVQADATYVEQVLRNLVGNADKYSPIDQPIRVEARVEGEKAVVSVMDRGPGLDEGEARRIFERFYRSEKTARQAGGIGIGLTVCKRLVEAQGGEIWAEPRDGGGLAVSFTIPLSQEDAADA